MSGPARSTSGILGRVQVSAAGAAERDRDRHQRIAAATVAGVASKVVVATSLLLAVPLAADHLTPAELGVWSILMTAVALVGWADLGLGNGLLNLLNAAVGRDEVDAARRAVAAALVGLAVVAAVMSALSLVALAVVPWESLLGLDPGEVPGLRRAVAAFAALIVVSIPAGIGQRVHLAYQQGWAASVTSGLGSAASLALVGIAALADAGIAWFVLAMLAGTTVAYAVETAWVLGRSHRDLVPRRGDLDGATLRRLSRSGAGFFALVLAAALAYQTDALVIANHLGAADATTYVLTNRLFMLAPTVLGALFLPLWPAYGEAIARGDLAWVARTLRRSLAAALGLSAAAALLVALAARPVLEVWSPDTAPPSTSLIVAMALWSIVTSVSLAVAMYLNGAHLLRFQLAVSSTMAVVNLTASIVLVRTMGSSGPVWATVVTQTAVVLVPSAVVLGRALRRTDGRSTPTRPPLATPGATP